MIKSTTLVRLLSKVSLLLLLIGGGAAVLYAQQEGQPSPQQAQPQQQMDQQQQQMDQQAQPTDQMNQPQATTKGGVPDSQAFNGKIVKSGGELVFQDSMGVSSYRIEDQRKAKAFEGKDVKITGAVDPSTKTIYIASIEPQ